MRRRDFIRLLGGAAAWPLAARAQQQAEKRYTVGILSAGGTPVLRTVLFDALRELGWIEGKNVVFEQRFAENRLERLPELAADLVRLKVDVIAAAGTLAPLAAKRATSTIPIVMTAAGDPLGSGLVASLARPGGNVTGTSLMATMAGKWLEVLKEISSRVKRVAFLLHPEHPAWAGYLRTVKDAASSFDVEVIPAGIRDAGEIDRVIDSFAREPNGGLFVLPDIVTYVHRELIIALAAGHRLPAIYPFRYFPAAGGLMSYGADPVDMFRRAAAYIDRILKGEKPADLPVQAPTKYELVINLKTAKALGIEVPPTLLARADEVIE
jgi:putative tryptophan/tyrosine transport system substrate-binding protein